MGEIAELAGSAVQASDRPDGLLEHVPGFIHYFSQICDFFAASGARGYYAVRRAHFSDMVQSASIPSQRGILMNIAFLNPQGNFDPQDSYWTEHPDFGGQLVYVKQVALAMEAMGHKVDVLTRQIIDPDWPEFSERFGYYPDAPNLRIIRLPAGGGKFLRKELLWPHLVAEWVPNILDFYHGEGNLPQAFIAHYGDGGLCGVLIEQQTGVPFTFTGHSLGAQKMDKLKVGPENLAEIDARYHFARRIVAERLSMNRSAVNVTSTRQERYEQYDHRAYRGAVDVSDDRRFEVIPPGVNLSIFDAGAQAENKREVLLRVNERLKRDIGPDRLGLPVIIASSRLDPKKNHLGLVQAFAHNPALHWKPNLVFITGALDDPLRKDSTASPTEKDVLAKIRQVVQKNDLWGKISAFALQGQPALAAAYRFLARRGSVFCLTALYEPFGLAPLEAAAAGLPVVVTRNGGPSESLQEGEQKYGILVDPEDPEDISAGLEYVISDPQVWKTYSRLGRQRVMERYTWERTAGSYLSLLEEIIKKPGARRPEELLPIHPYFLDPRPANDIHLETLKSLYFPK
ncbi:MAG: glycosyltransferase [Anaerolineales bacterium]